MGCMNSLCGASSPIEWKQGWPLRSGGFAHLCDKCGSAYEQSVFCEVFHSTESGWRECASCGKRLHCGCVVSRSLLELLDGGSGVKCIGCAKSSGIHMANGVSTIKLSEFQHLSPLGNHSDGSGFRHLLQPQNENTIGLFHKMKQEDVPGETGTPYFLNLNPGSIGPSEATKADFHRVHMGSAEIYDDSLPHTNLTMTLGSSLGHSNPFPGAIVDDREHGKQPSLFLQGARSRHVLPKPPRSNLAPSVDTNSGMVVSQVRVARPPAEGRGRNQLLPRYWPRITDQELQQISGDSNSTIVPLFEKMLSASDAGRIGRLVLPKACAEAYFPPISQPEGLPLKIQDVKGKEWVFQFRFWPNNNSRMYVLEGVTPCIQSMQLQAGDTVTFSRMDPEGKLIMGFRKASTSVTMQDMHQSAVHNGAHSSETLFSGVFENLPIISGYSGLLQSLKGNSEPQLSALSKHLSSTSADISWHKIERTEGKTKEGFAMPSPFLGPEKKRNRNIGSKIKRLHIDTQDALEIRITWEEAQDLLRPPPSIKPSTVIIDDHEFEEYEEPPVFGKRGIFIVRITGEQEQWSQCDGCSKWRKLPFDVLLPDKWTCGDNAWDPSRSSCSVPDELTPQELESLLKLNKEFKRQRTVSSQMPTPETESPGLDALASAAMLGDGTSAVAGPTSSVATTTKHPRHRPGCSCIVCIQPPSGKGKHKPSCTCNVCMTVKRRFKTLMMNKKKRQSEREAEIASRSGVKTVWGAEMEAESVSRHVSSSQLEPSDNEARSSANELEAETAKEAALDLNCDPGRDNGGESRGGMSTSTSRHRVSLVSLVRDANRPLEDYLKQNGLASLVSQEQQQQQQQQSSSPTQMAVQVANESETQPNEEQPNGVEPDDQSQNDPQ